MGGVRGMGMGIGQGWGGMGWDGVGWSATAWDGMGWSGMDVGWMWDAMRAKLGCGQMGLKRACTEMGCVRHGDGDAFGDG